MHLWWVFFLVFISIFIFIKAKFLIQGKFPLRKVQPNLIFNLVLAMTTIFITISMVIFPHEAFEASIQGLSIWWNVVFPALLPFFIMAQILIGLGVVHMMGVFLEPIMRPLFNVPGVGSFVLAMGLASGFPLGAIITADMRRKQMVSKIEAERLLSFVNTADPLFMFGAVAVGMLEQSQLGITIATAHYISTITVGLIMRFYRKKERHLTPDNNTQESIFYRSWKSMYQARKEDGRPIGQLMGDAISRSIETLLLIGGFIILFSVIIRVLTVAGFLEYVSVVISYLLNLVGLSVNLTPAIISGLLEIDLGCQFAATTNAPLTDTLIAIGFIIAWSGLSVHAQVASIISDTDLSITPYIWARVIHSLLAGFYTYLILVKPFSVLELISIPAFYHKTPSADLSFWFIRTVNIFHHLIIIMGALIIISLLIYGIHKKIKTAR